MASSMDIHTAGPWAGVAAVSWDVDGTLYDARAMKLRVLGAALRAPLRAARELPGLRRYNWAVEASRSNGGDVRGLRQRFERDHALAREASWCAGPIAAAGTRPGVVELLDALRARGIPQVVVSDYDPTYKLEALGLTHYFASVYAGELVGAVKPSPEPLLRAAKDLGIAPEALLHIGDRDETDGAAARAAGCRYWIVGLDVPDLATMCAQLPVERGGRREREEHEEQKRDT